MSISMQRKRERGDGGVKYKSTGSGWPIAAYMQGNEGMFGSFRLW